MPSLFYLLVKSLILKLCDDSCQEKMPTLLTNIDVKFLIKKSLANSTQKCIKIIHYEMGFICNVWMSEYIKTSKNLIYPLIDQSKMS